MSIYRKIVFTQLSDNLLTTEFRIQESGAGIRDENQYKVRFWILNSGSWILRTNKASE